jgi:hypothetical protein
MRFEANISDCSLLEVKDDWEKGYLLKIISKTG